METTERIVEAYVRHVKGWATISNIRCSGQNEIDLLAIDPRTFKKYHIEVSISISQSYRKLTGKTYDVKRAKERVHQAEQRRTIGFFKDKKFAAPGVLKRLEEFGFLPGEYTKVVTSWGWDDLAAKQAEEADIVLWDFRKLVQEIAEEIGESRSYYTDDTLRTISLFVHARNDAAKMSPEKADARKPAAQSTKAFWVYENSIHKYASIHRAECSYCKDGGGFHPGSTKKNGEWHGPFKSLSDAEKRAARTKRSDLRMCRSCRPNVAR